MSYLSAASETIGVIKTAVCACENYRGTNAHLTYLGISICYAKSQGYYGILFESHETVGYCYGNRKS